MFWNLFTIVSVAGIAPYKIASKIIDDVFNSYSLHWQVKLKPTFPHMPQNNINEMILVH